MEQSSEAFKSFTVDFISSSDAKYVNEHSYVIWKSLEEQMKGSGYIPIIDSVVLTKFVDKGNQSEWTMGCIGVQMSTSGVEYITSDGYVQWKGTRKNR